MAKERKRNRRLLVANPDEPRAGDNAFDLYDKVHAVSGYDGELTSDFRSELRGLRGQTVTVVVHGARLDDSGDETRFRVQRTITYNEYGDIFGPGGAYLSGIKAVLAKNSDDKIITYSVTVEPNTGEDDYE